VTLIAVNNDLIIGYVIIAICNPFGNTLPCAVGPQHLPKKNKAKMRGRYLKTKLRKVQGSIH
jgi:hypothetical protein